MIETPKAFMTGTYHDKQGNTKLAMLSSYHVNEATKERRANLTVLPDGKHTQAVSYHHHVRIGGDSGERFVPFIAEPVGKEPKDGDGNGGSGVPDGNKPGGGSGGQGRGPVRGGNGGRGRADG